VKKLGGSLFAETGEDACPPIVWLVTMGGRRRNRRDACLPRQAGRLFAETGETPVLLLFGLSQWVAGEETGWKPVCRDHRLAGQAGEDACPPK
jgi:hypothetical protein